MVDTFQTTVNAYIAPGKKGGWASANPHVSLQPPETGDLTAASSSSWQVGASGCLIGNFAFADTATGYVTNAHPGTGLTTQGGPSPVVGPVRVGFVQEDQVSLITAYLGGDTMALIPGGPVSLITRGDVWAQFAGGANVGQFVFASFADGSLTAQNSITPPTTTFAATTTNTSPNLTSVGAGAVAGQPITGTGIPAGTYLVSVNAVAGTAVMSANATASGAITVTATTAAYTDFRVDTLTAAGGIGKISVWA